MSPSHLFSILFAFDLIRNPIKAELPEEARGAPLSPGQTNRLLGYPEDARLLIINADDFGMCHSVNEAVFRALERGVLRSTTLMVPCPGPRNGAYAPSTIHIHHEFSSANPSRLL